MKGKGEWQRQRRGRNSWQPLLGLFRWGRGGFPLQPPLLNYIYRYSQLHRNYPLLIFIFCIFLFSLCICSLLIISIILTTRSARSTEDLLITSNSIQQTQLHNMTVCQSINQGDDGKRKPKRVYLAKLYSWSKSPFSLILPRSLLDPTALTAD